jgi:dihydrofolate reductase
MITILVAYDENLVIGNKGSIPWHIPSDWRLFKERTIGNAVVMGRNTWASLPSRPLFNRVNVIISQKYCNDPDSLMVTLNSENGEVYCVSNLKSAIFLLKESFPEKRIFIIGGGKVYQESIELGIVDKIIVSRVRGKHEGDTYFPILDENWYCKQVDNHDRFDILEFTRR